MRLSLSTGTLYIYPLRQVFRWAATAGFDSVELVVNPEAIVRGGSAVRRMAQEEGVALLSVHPTVVPLPGWRERHGGMEPTIRLALEAGAGLVVMHTPRAESLDLGEGLAFRRRIEIWQPRLAGSGLRLSVENKAVWKEVDRRYVLTPLERLRSFADCYDLDLVLDTTHAGAAGDDLLRARQVFNGRLANVHLSDMREATPHASGRGWAGRRVQVALGQHCFPGAGDLDLAGLLADLAGSHYTGPITLEMNPFAARFWWPPAVCRRLAQAADWVKQIVGRDSPAVR